MLRGSAVVETSSEESVRGLNLLANRLLNLEFCSVAVNVKAHRYTTDPYHQQFELVGTVEAQPADEIFQQWFEQRRSRRKEVSTEVRFDPGPNEPHNPVHWNLIMPFDME